MSYARLSQQDALIQRFRNVPLSVFRRMGTDGRRALREAIAACPYAAMTARRFGVIDKLDAA